MQKPCDFLGAEQQQMQFHSSTLGPVSLPACTEGGFVSGSRVWRWSGWRKQPTRACSGADLRQSLVIKRGKILADRVQGSGTQPGSIAVYFVQDQHHILQLNLGQDYFYNTPRRNNNEDSDCNNTSASSQPMLHYPFFTPHSRSRRQELSFSC